MTTGAFTHGNTVPFLQFSVLHIRLTTILSNFCHGCFPSWNLCSFNAKWFPHWAVPQEGARHSFLQLGNWGISGYIQTTNLQHALTTLLLGHSVNVRKTVKIQQRQHRVRLGTYQSKKQYLAPSVYEQAQRSSCLFQSSLCL